MGIVIDNSAKISGMSILDDGRSGWIEIGRRSNVKHGAVIRAMGNRVVLGQRVSIGEYSYIAGHGGVTIGDFSIIAPHCCISAANHIFVDDKVPIRFQGESACGIIIGKDVWIGARSVILDGVTIGDGCVVGAGSVVTRSLEPRVIAFGAPARVHRKRLPGE